MANMSLDHILIQKEYRTNVVDIVKEFYIPVLGEAILYKRAVGFFSSTSLVQITKGICKLAYNGGKIELIASPKLSLEDIEAIQHGYEDRDAIIERTLLREVEKVDYSSLDRFNLLAHLIADGILSIKIAFMDNGSSIGIYHEKMGIIEDENGNKVAFSGSMNESHNAMFSNYESIDVYRNWGSEDELERLELKEKAFDSIWYNRAEKMIVKEFPVVCDRIKQLYKRGNIDYSLDAKDFLEDNSHCGEWSIVKNLYYPKVPDDFDVREYQDRAVSKWEEQNCKGIFDMATGTGKTYTALLAIARLYQNNRNRLGVVIVCPYQHLVEQWKKDIEKFNMKPILCYSTAIRKYGGWRKEFEMAVDMFRKGKRDHFCVVVTNSSFSLQDFQSILGELSKDVVPKVMSIVGL